MARNFDSILSSGFAAKTSDKSALSRGVGARAFCAFDLAGRIVGIRIASLSEAFEKLSGIGGTIWRNGRCVADAWGD